MNDFNFMCTYLFVDVFFPNEGIKKTAKEIADIIKEVDVNGAFQINFIFCLKIVDFSTQVMEKLILSSSVQ